MNEHKCNSCFYMQNERSRSPCNVCEGYNKYVNRNIYIQRPDTIEIKTWTDDDYFDEYEKERYIEVVDTDEDFDDYGGSEDYVKKGYDSVYSPKHYMLFEDKGIEVRHVIEKLVGKIHDSTTLSTPGYALFEADYVQLMQYLMRFMDKNGAEDLKKARWYLDRMVEAYERSSD